VTKSTAGRTTVVFEPKELKGGRVKVYGCSPGCLLASLAISLVLTLAVNGCIYLL
jgi:RNA 3'-terminal phosphate cyclase